MHMDLMRHTLLNGTDGCHKDKLNDLTPNAFIFLFSFHLILNHILLKSNLAMLDGKGNF